MLDVSRDRVPTLKTLRRLVRELAHLKVNELQLYFEHPFKYKGHRTVWEGASAYTGKWCQQQQQQLSAVCSHISLPP